ncbi:MAG: hypothetical protein RML38_10365 [Bacteroidia bacterium]|nr:hypothetical protein [Bacteroidia bacterium]
MNHEKHIITFVAGFIHGLYHFVVSSQVLKAFLIGACTSIGGYVGLWLFKQLLKGIQKIFKNK